MTRFKYIAYNSKGERVTGFIENQAMDAAKEVLSSKKLRVESIVSARKRGAFLKNWTPKRQGFSLAEQQHFAEQLYLTLKTGLSLEEALNIAKGQFAGTGKEEILNNAQSALTSGEELSTSLHRTGWFSDHFIAAVQVGESTGQLDKAFQMLAAHLETKRETVSKVKEALAYPAFMLIFGAAVIVTLLSTVVPQLSKMFEEMGQELPILTRAVINTSESLNAWGPVLIIAAAVLFFLLNKPLYKRRVRVLVERAILATPMLSRVATEHFTATFLRSLAHLVGSGVTLLHSLQIAAKGLPLIGFEQELKSITEKIEGGGELSTALAAAGCFPPLVAKLSKSAEVSGELDEVLDRIACFYESKTEKNLKAVQIIAEPALILIVGAIVGIMVTAMILPIFEASQLL